MSLIGTCLYGQKRKTLSCFNLELFTVIYR
eukprot:UN03629